MKARAVRGKLAFALTATTLAYSLALLVLFVALPTAEGQTSLQSGVLRDLALFGQPLVVTLLLWSLLHERCTSGSDGAAVAAHAVSGVFLLYSVMGGFTIAVGALPAALLLFLAVNVTPRPEPIQL